MPEQSITTKLESMLYSMARIFAADGAATEVAVITYSTPEVSEPYREEWNEPTNMYSVTLHVPIGLFLQFASRADDIEEKLNTKLLLFCDYNSHEQIRRLKLRPAVTDEPDWRARAHAWLSGVGVSNQGRVRSDNVAPLSVNGLLFRSQQEINLYKALKEMGVSFAPLAVFIRGGDEYRRIEPDFFIVRNGFSMVVEVDGDTVHTETPEEAHARTTMLQHEGVHIERIRASECDTPEKARASARSLLETMNKVKESRK
jgi:hypothetical protein